LVLEPLSDQELTEFVQSLRPNYRVDIRPNYDSKVVATVDAVVTRLNARLNRLPDDHARIDLVKDVLEGSGQLADLDPRKVNAYLESLFPHGLSPSAPAFSQAPALDSARADFSSPSPAADPYLPRPSTTSGPLPSSDGANVTGFTPVRQNLPGPGRPQPTGGRAADRRPRPTPRPSRPVAPAIPAAPAAPPETGSYDAWYSDPAPALAAPEPAAPAVDTNAVGSAMTPQEAEVYGAVTTWLTENVDNKDLTTTDLDDHLRATTPVPAMSPEAVDRIKLMAIDAFVPETTPEGSDQS
jgi:hypothetical protein